MPRSPVEQGQATVGKQSLHVAHAPAITMAGGWRRFLEEESEHQWISIGVFFAFIILGALAIGATEHFVGAREVDIQAAHRGGLVTEIVYGPSQNAYTALVYSPQAGYELYTEDTYHGTITPIYTPDTLDKGADVKFLKLMPNGEVLFSVANNEVIGLQGNEMVTYVYPTTNGEFGILDAAEIGDGETVQRILLTQEGAKTSVRGISGMQPTHPMSTSSGVQWHSIEAIGDNRWLALGIHIGTAGADGSSPATPQARPVLGWIVWDGSEATPELETVRTYAGGVFHGMAVTDDGVVVGGTEESLLVRGPDTIESLGVRSTAMAMDEEGTVWLFGQLGSTVLWTVEEGELETHVLGRAMPVEPSAVGAIGSHVHVHGTDDQGQPVEWSIDISANGSIESGRGFLNLLYLLTGSVVLALMLRYAINEYVLQG